MPYGCFFTVDLCCRFIFDDISDWNKLTGLPRSYHIGRKSDFLVTALVGEGLEGFSHCFVLVIIVK